jgi:hypothetical protein
MSTTRVISVRGKGRATLLADPSFVYVGRACRGWPASIWQNRLKVGATHWEAFRFAHDLKLKSRPPPYEWAREPTDAEQVVECYAKWLTFQKDLMGRLHELRGKTLGCWCVDWDGTGEPEKPCHAVILARLAEAAPGGGGGPG